MTDTNADDGFVDIAGHAHWVPLPLDATPEQLERELTERFAATTEARDLELGVSAAVGAARTLGSSTGIDDSGVIVCAAWSWLSRPDVFVPAATAVLRGVALRSERSVDDCIRLVTADAALHGTPQVDELQTQSGPAYVVRFRPIVGAEQGTGSEVHQAVTVLWPRLETRVLFLLTSYTTDLTEGPELAQALEELAAGVTGI